MTQHSPTPWRQPSDGQKTYASVRSADGRCVADCGSRSDVVAQVNAAHIVRAVNSFDELLALVRTYWQTRSEERWKAEEPEIHAAILAAIAHAEAEQPAQPAARASLLPSPDDA